MSKKNRKSCPGIKSVVVSGYMRKDGTYVNKHRRSLPNTCVSSKYLKHK